MSDSIGGISKAIETGMYNVIGKPNGPLGSTVQ